MLPLSRVVPTVHEPTGPTSQLLHQFWPRTIVLRVVQDGPVQLLFAGTNSCECGSDVGFGVNVTDVFVPPHGVASHISRRP